ncbi:probable asparagine--tRNA ligase, mitochondrial [Ylistrum balloti]|uniref:probable asparagine--tRNA ligase, mitochondrial n=1 Tax=Ylistrum balloti TaxID=509963 RepID=UPI00290584CA|nr:probable asparagine--tRNA ligase, mitochondrial [Ylistrum balloti]
MAAPLIRKPGNYFLGAFKRFRAKHKLTFCNYSNLRQSINEILNTSEEQNEIKGISVKGWILAVQKHRSVTFMHLTDGSTSKHLQVVIDGDISEKVTCHGGSVNVSGNLIRSPGSLQKWELLAKKVEVIGTSDNSFPIGPAKAKQPLDTTREYLHLRPRSKVNSSIFRVRNAATMAIHKFFQVNNFLYVHTPMLTSNDCEGAGEVFSVKPHDEDLVDEIVDKEIQEMAASGKKNKDFFKCPVFLTVSGQLHLESFLGTFGKVYNFGPAFRAESQSSGRYHLSEFYMVEGEVAFLNDLEGLLTVMEDLVKFSTKEIYENSEEEVNFIANYIDDRQHTNNITAMMEKEFVRMSYTDAVKILEKKKKKFDVEVKWGDDLKKEHERYLVKHCGTVPVFLTDFPASIKPFYALENTDNRTAAAVDLLVPEVGELFGGTLREHRFDHLERKLKAVGQDEQLGWYLDLRKYGTVPHGGFGMGFERYLQFITGVRNIRDTIPFPRTPLHCKM